MSFKKFIREEYEKRDLFDTHPSKFKIGDIVTFSDNHTNEPSGTIKKIWKAEDWNKEFHDNSKETIYSIRWDGDNRNFVIGLHNSYEESQLKKITPLKESEYKYTGGEKRNSYYPTYLTLAPVNEEYFDTYKLRNTNVEIWKNPSKSEVSTSRMDRGILDSKSNLYVWDGEAPVIHADVLHKLKFDTSISLYLKQNKYVEEVQISTFDYPSKSFNDIYKIVMNNKNVKRYMGGDFEVNRELEDLGI